jgi:uncharacterized membrane protein
MHVEKSVRIAAPADEIWRVLADVERWPEWTASMQRVERLDDGEFTVGSRARVRQPKLRPAIFEVTESTPGESFVWRARVSGTEMLAGHYLRPDGDATLTRLTFDHTGALAGVIDLFYGKLIREYVGMETAGLRRHCEAA